MTAHRHGYSVTEPIPSITQSITSQCENYGAGKDNPWSKRGHARHYPAKVGHTVNEDELDAVTDHLVDRVEYPPASNRLGANNSSPDPS